jgi:uncharacterized repeat protein (TIGR01451 family)
LRRRSFNLAVLLLGAVLVGWTVRAAAQAWQPETAAPPPAPVRPAPGQTVIAVSHRIVDPAPPVRPVAPAPGIELLRPPPVIGSSQQPPPSLASPPALQTPTPVPDAPPPAPQAPPAVSPTAPTPVPPSVPPPVLPPAAASGPTASSVTATLTVETTATPTHNVGKPFQYEIIVRNTGPAPVHGVRVQEELSAGVRCLAVEPQADARGNQLHWSIGELEANGERHLKITVQPPSEGEFQSSPTATFSMAAAQRTRVTRPQLAVEKVGPETAQVGDKVPFVIKVRNTGTGSLPGVKIHDTLPAELQHPEGSEIEADVGSVAAGETKEIKLEPTAMTPGRVVNEVLATSADGQRATARATVNLVQAALLLRKTGPREALIGYELDHRLEVVNLGQGPATNVLLTDVLPAGLDFISASDGGAYDGDKRRCEWSLGTLGPGQTRAVTISIRARAPGNWVNQAVVRADRVPEATAGQSVQVDGAPGITLEVVDLDDPVEVGTETTYEIRVVNQGGCACDAVRVTAELPAGLQPTSAEGPADHRIEGQRVVFEPMLKLAARADAVYRVKAKARLPGEWHFAVYLQTAHMQRPVLKEESTTVYNDAETDHLPGTKQGKRSLGPPKP